MTTESHEVTSTGQTTGAHLKIARKRFTYPSGIEVDVMVEERDFWGRVNLVPGKVAQSKAAVLEQVQAFANELQPDRLINICEYTTCLDRIGDDGRTNWIIWYWEPEE